MTTRRNTHHPYALVIAHSDGRIHVRTRLFGAVAAALCKGGLEFAVDLAPDDCEGPRCFDIRVWVHDDYLDGDADVVAGHLRGYGILAYAYESFHEEEADGPLVQYRYAGSHGAPPDRARLVFNIDYGSDGSWYFGTPDMVGFVARMAANRGLRTYIVGPMDRPQAVAVDSNPTVRRDLAAGLRLGGIWVHEDDFGTVDAGDENTHEAADDV